MVTENKKKSLGGRGRAYRGLQNSDYLVTFISKNKNVHSKAADEAIVDFKILKSYYDVFLKKKTYKRRPWTRLSSTSLLASSMLSSRTMSGVFGLFLVFIRSLFAIY